MRRVDLYKRETASARALLELLDRDGGEAWVVPAQLRMVRRLVAKGWVLLTAERRKNLQRWSIEAKVVRADKPRWVSA